MINIKNNKLHPSAFIVQQVGSSENFYDYKRKNKIPKYFADNFATIPDNHKGCYLSETDNVDILIVPVVERNKITGYWWCWLNSKHIIFKSGIFHCGSTNTNDIRTVLKQISDFETEYYEGERSKQKRKK